MKSKKITLKGTIERETEKAILFNEAGNKMWFPKSMIEIVEEGIIVDEWFWAKKILDQGYNLKQDYRARGKA